MIQGDFEGKCVKIEIGADSKQRPMIRGEMEIVGGPNAGARIPYDGKLDEKGIKWTKADMLALGWQGKDVCTLTADVSSAAKVVPFKVEIARWQKDDGSVKEWSTVRSIGRGVQPLAPLAEAKAADVNKWFAEVGDESKVGDESIPF